MVVLRPCFMQGQVVINEKGDKNFEKGKFEKALKEYEEADQEGWGRKQWWRIGETYESLGKIGKSLQSYQKATEASDSKPLTFYNYGEKQMGAGKYEDAKYSFQKYVEMGGDREKGKRQARACEYAAELQLDSSRYKIKALPLNSKYPEFAAIRYLDGYIFTSARPRGFFTMIGNGDKTYLDLYQASPSPGKKDPFKVRLLKGKINTRFHEGVAEYNKSNAKLYFSRSVKGKKGDSLASSIRNKLKVYSSKRRGKKWKAIDELPFNQDGYSFGHPALSVDGMTMVFASDRKGGYGGSDLWVTFRDSSGWREPKNLGPEINSEGDELFPALHSTGILFFSSDGHSGMGGMDIFSAKVDGEGWKDVANAGYPLNSGADDFGVYWDRGKARGLFSSNRKGGAGDDDIYTFSRRTEIQGVVVDSRKKNPLADVTVTLLEANGNISKFKTDKDGAYKLFVDYGKDYQLTFELDEYEKQKERVKTSTVGPVDDLTVDIDLVRDLYFTIEGLVADTSGQPIRNARIALLTNNGSSDLRSGDDGKYESKLDLETEYSILVTADGFIPYTMILSTVGLDESNEFSRNISLTPGRGGIVEGKVVENESDKVIPGAFVRVISDKNLEESSVCQSRSDGKFFAVIDSSKEQFMVATGRGYFSSRMDLDAAVDSNGFPQRVEFLMVPYQVGQIAKTIYYGYRQSNLNSQASRDLYSLVYFLQDNPEASVELGAHTDSRGSATFNMRLSQRRAEAAVRFITRHGIKKQRIVAAGYGETQLVNDCGDGKNCSDEQHAMNRRAELRITEIMPKKDQTGDLDEDEEPEFDSDDNP